MKGSVESMIMPEFIYQTINWAVIIAGVTVVLAGAIWLFWWSIGRVIKMLGYWKIFYRAMMIAGKQIYDEKRKR